MDMDIQLSIELMLIPTFNLNALKDVRSTRCVPLINEKAPLFQHHTPLQQSGSCDHSMASASTALELSLGSHRLELLAEPLHWESDHVVVAPAQLANKAPSVSCSAVA